MLVKIGIVLFLAAILFNLGASFWYMLTDRSQGDRTVRSLTWRIGLSILLIALIGLGIATGVIQPHDIGGR